MTKKGKPGHDAYDFDTEGDEQDALIAIGKQLLALPKSKDAVLNLLKRARAALEQTPQSSEGAKLATSDLSKALGRKELVAHKDKEVRLYTASCLAQVLRILAPDTPYSDAELKAIFGLFSSVYAELEDPAGPNFQLCLSVFELVSQVKCSVLMLDLDEDDLVCELFSTVFGAVNEENLGMLEASALQLLGSMLEESDDISQQLLDTILVNLLPGKQQESHAACRLAQLLLQHKEAAVQPYMQKFLSGALLGLRSDSELKDDCHSLIFQLYQVVPQVLLPVLPHLGPELQVENEAKRLAAVELLGRLFSRPGSGGMLREYAELFQDLLKRLHDQKVDVRLKVLGYCKGLLENCSDDSAMRRTIMQGIQDRLMDIDDKVRSAAAGIFCEIAADHPALAQSGLEALLGRLRDKKVPVRREVASQIMGLVRGWCMKCQQNTPGAPKKHQIIQVVLVLCNLSTRDADLMTYAVGHLFKAGLFSSKLPMAAQVEWWTLLWQRAGDTGHEAIVKLLRSKYNLQKQVRELIQLREAVKERRQVAGGATSSLAVSGTGSALQPGTSNASVIGDPEKPLHMSMAKLAKALHDVHKAEEGLHKLWEMKDNHIFRGLATLAAPGTTLEQATSSGKDVVQRVGAKGPAAEVARALVSCMTPSLLPPELLHMAMEHAADSQEAQTLLVDMAAIVPQLFAQSLGPLVDMLDQDDPTLASCATKILAKAGRYLAAASQGKKEAAKEWGELVEKMEGTLLEMCGGSSPSAAKAAVYAMVMLVGAERATAALRPACEAALDAMKRPSTINNHPKLLTAIKALSTIGRTLPQLFAEHADEFADFVMEQLLVEDLSGGKPLRQKTEATGEEWGRPTAGIDVKAAALKALAQAFVPDSRKAQQQAAKDLGDTVQVVLAKLVELMNPDEDSEAFEAVGLEGAVDGAWLRCAVAGGMLRLARAHDHTLSIDQYVELALSLQDPRAEARRLLVTKVMKTVKYFENSPQRAAKYAAILGLLAVDPLPANQSAAFRVLREYVAFRRRELQIAAQETAAAGGGGGNMIQDMPEFMLPYLIFILSHHPDYPTAEELQEWEDLGEEEREEMEEQGQGPPLAPFQTMLQFVLEPLVFPAEAPINPTEIGQAIPASLKLLRTLKLCEDASPDEQRCTESAHQLCDMAMALVKAMVDRVTQGKPVELGRFPGSVLLPKLFKYQGRSEDKKPDGSNLPPHFTPLLTDELFSQRFANMVLPGAGKRPRSRGGARGGRHGQQEQGGGPSGEGKQAAGGDGSQDTSRHTGSDEDADEEVDCGPGSSSKAKKGTMRKGGSAQQQQQAKRPSKPAKRKQPPDGAQDDKAAAAPKRKRAAAGAAQKKPKKEAKLESPATRQQPRRGAKAVASTKLRADTSEEEDDEEQEEQLQQQQQPGRPSGRRPAGVPAQAVAAARPAAAAADDDDDDPMPQCDFENAGMGSPGRGLASAAAAAPRRQQQHQEAKNLRANSEDEWSDEDEEQQQPASGQPQAAAPRPPAGAKELAGGKGGAAKGAKAGKGALVAAALKPKSKNIRA